ncbi:alpha/beta hydrolase [Aestuariicella hydrocarbonica]|uniref:Alpha/beta hydrolase n=1 Tax=Pseudomaricurvus hydrocarbonicus TaxID=1470433 RepID=A0A9E5JTP8_9GAMM|nr:alpha/beta hydrolase [Aestuariicella hydrocarbonica]NHO64346.1 alpha/beta hydrolase [Aestuariicella hydrocarbonica]
MAVYSDVYYPVSDGLRLYARDYPLAEGVPEPGFTLLCLHGLSRNSADFEPLCEGLGDGYRIVVPDQRGRGLSDWDSDSNRYHLLTYVQDMWQLLDHLQIEKVLIVGTSMGGLMGMVMAGQRPDRIAGLAINDVGPEVDPAGLSRIMSYVGKGGEITCWDDAVEHTRALNTVCFPDYNRSQWLTMAQRLYRENDAGVPVVAYDPMISAPIASSVEHAVPADLWPVFRTLKDTPLLVLRGALSDLLSRQCFLRMQQEVPDCVAVEVPGVGHAPALDEKEALKAIQQFIATCSQQ